MIDKQGNPQPNISNYENAMMKKKKTLRDIPIEIRAEKALREAVANAITEHKRAGVPITIWHDGVKSFRSLRIRLKCMKSRLNTKSYRKAANKHAMAT